MTGLCPVTTLLEALQYYTLNLAFTRAFTFDRFYFIIRRYLDYIYANIKFIR